MLKLYKGTAEQLLLLALYHQDQIGHTLPTVVDRTRNAAGRNPGAQQVINMARKSAQLVPSSKTEHWPSDLIEGLIRGIQDDDSPRGDKNLLDQIVLCLQMPYSRNVLSGDALRRLRQALLLPSEQAGLNARLTAREMSCSQCGIPLHDRESVTIMRTGDNAQTLVCHRCSSPHHVPCASCENVANLSSKAMAAMSRMQCESCNAKKATALKSPPPLEEVEAPHPVFRSGRGAAGAVTRAGGGVPTPRGGQPRVAPGGPNPIWRPDGINLNAPIADRATFALGALRQAISNNDVPANTLADIGEHVLVNSEGIFSEDRR